LSLHRNIANILDNWLDGRILLRVEAFVIIWSIWLCINENILIIKLLFYACYLLVYRYTPFVAVPTTSGAS
jgi:hypothetical protein